MASPENTTVPNVQQSRDFGDLYSVEVDGAACGRLMSVLGMPGEEITRQYIVVTPEIPTHVHGRESQTFGEHIPILRTTNLYPSVIWNLHQEILTRNRLSCNGEATLRKIYYRTNGVYEPIVSRRIFYLDSEEDIKKYQSTWRNSSTRYLHKHLSKQEVSEFLGNVEDKNLPAADEILLRAINRMLINGLAHEIKHSADSPLILQSREVFKKVMSSVPSIFTFFAILATRLMPVENSPVQDALLATAAGIPTYRFTNRRIEGWSYQISPWEIGARRFGTKIQNDPAWQDLIKTGHGWEYMDTDNTGDDNPGTA